MSPSDTNSDSNRDSSSHSGSESESGPEKPPACFWDLANTALHHHTENLTDVRRPRKLDDLRRLRDDEILKEGDITESRYEMELRESELNEKGQNISKEHKKNACCIRRFCSCLDEDGDACEYNFYAAFRAPKDSTKANHGKWECKELQHHTCVGRGGTQARQKNTAYSMEEMVPIIRHLMGKGAKLSPSSIKAALREYLNGEISDSKANRLKRKAKEDIVGVGKDDIQYFPAYVAALNDLGHDATGHYANSDELIDMLVNKLKKEHKSAQKYLPEDERTTFDKALTTEEVTARVLKGEEEADVPEGEASYLVGWAVIPQSALNTPLKNLPSQDFADAMHSKHDIGGAITNSVTLDSNRCLFPLCLSWSVHNESRKTWDQHNQKIADQFGLDYDTVDRRKIIDWDKGGVPSGRAFLKRGCIVSCGNHRKPHVQAKGTASDAYLYKQSLKERDPNAVLKNIASMSPSGRRYIMAFKEAKSAKVQKDSPTLQEQFSIFAGNMGGHTNQAYSESANNQNALIRTVNPFGEFSFF